MASSQGHAISQSRRASGGAGRTLTVTRRHAREKPYHRAELAKKLRQVLDGDGAAARPSRVEKRRAGVTRAASSQRSLQSIISRLAR